MTLRVGGGVKWSGAGGEVDGVVGDEGVLCALEMEGGQSGGWRSRGAQKGI